MDTVNPHQELLTRLFAIAKKRQFGSRVINWQFGSVNADMAALARGNSRDEYLVHATVGKMFAIFHTGSVTVLPGVKDKNIGDTLRNVGYYSEPAVKRLYERLITASQLSELHDVLIDITKQLRSVSRGSGKPWMSPNWLLLLDDLDQWLDSNQRDNVRLRWAQQFLTWNNKTTDSTTDDHSSDDANDGQQLHINI